MDRDIEELKALRNSFRKCADIIDGIIDLDQELPVGDYTEKSENLIGKILVEYLKINNISKKLDSII
jgi:hypothetical protein